MLKRSGLFDHNPKSLKQDRRVWIWASRGDAGGGRGADSNGQEKGEKCPIKMIFIDCLVAAAVRLHYKLKAQVRALRRTTEPIKWSAANRPVLRVQPRESSEHRRAILC